MRYEGNAYPPFLDLAVEITKNIQYKINTLIEIHFHIKPVV